MSHSKNWIAVMGFVGMTIVLMPVAAKHGILERMSGTTVMIDNQPLREGSGTTASITRPVPRFSRIELRAAERLKVVRGDKVGLKLTGDDNLLELIGAEVRGDTLIIEPKSSYRSRKPIDIEVTMPGLAGLTLSGSSDARLEALDPAGFELRLDGSGNVVASGRVGKLDVRINGSGNAELAGVDAQRAEATVNGSGNIELGLADALDAEINGSGDIVYRGEPKPLRTRVNGSGDIRRH